MGRESENKRELTVSLKIRTASKGSQWIALMNDLGSYAPIGMRARSNPPQRCPISSNAGQTGRERSTEWSAEAAEAGRAEYPVSPANKNLRVGVGGEVVVERGSMTKEAHREAALRRGGEKNRVSFE